MPEMTPLEAAEKLEIVKEMSFPSYAKLIQPAIDYLREIANGEYKQVVHARWIEHSDYDNKTKQLLTSEDTMCCSNCHHSFNYYDNCTERFAYCPSCGAVMGKDDNYD